MLQRTVLSIKSGCYNEHWCYNESGGILSDDVTRACAWRIGPPPTVIMTSVIVFFIIWKAHLSAQFSYLLNFISLLHLYMFDLNGNFGFKNWNFLISDFRRDLNIVYFLLGISPASNCSWPTFRNPASVPSSKARCTVWGVPSQAKPSQAKPSQAKPSQAKPKF